MICFTTLFLLLAAERCPAAAWEGTDDFSSGISVTKWTVYNQYKGQMTVMATNGHASFFVPVTTTNEQNAILIWKGQPTVTNDWIVEIKGHNSADWSTNGSSQFQFVFYDTATLQTSLRGYGFSMARGRHGSPIPQVRVETGFAERTNTPAPSPDFAMRMLYSSTSKNIEAWWDENGNGSSWTPLDKINLEDVSPGMGTVTTNSFTFVIQPDTYYGPITEGQLWADNFRITSSAAQECRFLSFDRTGAITFQASDTNLYVGFQSTRELGGTNGWNPVEQYWSLAVTNTTMTVYFPSNFSSSRLFLRLICATNPLPPIVVGNTYEVYGGDSFSTGEPRWFDKGYDPASYGYVRLGSATNTATFSGSYNVYIVRAPPYNTARVDTVRGSSGSYFSTRITGNTTDGQNVGGPPDGLFAEVGVLHLDRGGFIVIDATGQSLASLTVSISP